MQRLTIAFLLALQLILFGIHLSYAQTVYVTDNFEITLRTGPSVENKIIAMLSTGTKLTAVKEEGEWLFVHTSAQQEGWILKRYASAETPKKIIIEQLQQKYNDALKSSKTATQQVKTLENENRELRLSLGTSQEELSIVRQKYSNIVNESKDFLQLKEKHTINLDKLKKATSELEQLKKENSELYSASSIRWFLTGASVVIISWIFGYVMGKIKRRDSSHSLYR